MRTPNRVGYPALIVALAAAMAVVRLAYFPPNQATLPPVPARAQASPAAELPQMHPFNTPSRSPAARVRARVERAEQQPNHEWASAIPVPETVQETSEPPVSEQAHAAHAATPAENDHFLPQLVVCRPDEQPAAAAEVIQDCINRAPPFSAIEIPAGTYELHRQIVVARPLTLRTAGSAGSSLSCVAGSEGCAVLVAAPDLLDRWGPVAVMSTSNVTLEHLVIDGNGAARAASRAAELCTRGDNTYGFNATVLDCVNCGLDDVVSRNALCGSAMVWSGGLANIRNSAFVSNGNAGTRLWADGLTLLSAPRSVIRRNQFVDNSDVSLIIGYGIQSRVEENMVLQKTQPSFAGMMLDNFNSDDLNVRGDFRGAVITNNTVDCGPQLCAFGIQVGPHPWYPTHNVVGGELHDNAVRGAKIGINVDGAGAWRAPTAIYANTVEPPPPGSYFTECPKRIAATWMNVSPSSVVDRRDDETETASHLSDSCQLFSDLSSRGD